MLYAVTNVSTNKKTGPIPVSYTERASCPDACTLKDNGCYAESGPVRFAWNRTETGMDLDAFVGWIQQLPKRTFWRHNVAGDLPGVGNRIYPAQLSRISAASWHTRGFTYTHKPLTRANIDILRFHHDLQAYYTPRKPDALGRGLTINVSTDNISMADAAVDARVGPVVTILPIDAPPISRTPKGRKVIACPAETKAVTCDDCRWCGRLHRDFIVGFRAHGSKKKAVDLIAREAA